MYVVQLAQPHNIMKFSQILFPEEIFIANQYITKT